MAKIRFSISAALGAAAEDLCATPSTQHDARIRRAVGRALMGCEPLGFSRASIVKQGTQGLQVTLGFYDDCDRGVIEDNMSLVEISLANSIGGFSGGFQVETQGLDDQWLGTEFPGKKAGNRHLHRYLGEDVWEHKIGSDNRRGIQRLNLPEAMILLRRLRYRGGVDHSETGDRTDLMVWSTPTTVEWARQFDDCGRGGEKVLKELVHYLSRHWHFSTQEGGKVRKKTLNSDWVTHSPDYWGGVDLESDPLRVLPVTVKYGATRKDVNLVLGRASGQLDLCRVEKTPTSDKDQPLRCFIKKLSAIADRVGLCRDYDIVFAYRGGGVTDDNVTDSDRSELLAACSRIRDQGVEVVVGIGHGDVCVLRPRNSRVDLPIGVFEATTPSTGAQWILREHVNMRMVDLQIDPGQSVNPSVDE